MDNDAFRHWSTVAAAWGADYREHIREYPVRAQTAPGEIAAQIPDAIAPIEAKLTPAMPLTFTGPPVQ